MKLNLDWERDEIAALLRYKSTKLSDLAIALAYLVGDAQWDKASQTLMEMSHTISLAAGYCARLLPISATNEPIPSGEPEQQVSPTCYPQNKTGT